MAMDRIFIGLVGPIASGKGVVAQYLRDSGFKYFSFSDAVREETTSRGLNITRENLQNIGNDLRAIYGGHILAERVLNKVTNESMIVLDGIRNPSEIEFLKDTVNILIIGINAPEDLRLEWYLARSQERGEDGITKEDFILANNRDLGLGEEQSGQQVGRCLEMSDVVINNLGSKSDLLEGIRSILSEGYGLSLEGSPVHPEKQ